MKESFLQAKWETQAQRVRTYRAICGQSLQLIHPGIPNPGSGPDFECGVVKVNDVLFAGNIEIHIDREDFFRHHHEKDPAFSNLLLHVFLKRGNFEKDIPGVAFEICLEDNGVRVSEITEQPSILKKLYCHNKINRLSKRTIYEIKLKMFEQRLKDRHVLIQSILNRTQRDWQQAYILMSARVFGGSFNNEVFSRLIQRLPGRELLKKRGRKNDVLSFLMANSGIPVPQGAEMRLSQEDWNIFDNLMKHEKHAKSDLIWKSGKIRPSSKPNEMITMFIDLLPFIAMGFHEFPRLEPGQETFNFVVAHLEKSISEAAGHGRLLQSGRRRLEGIANNLIINSIIPIVYSYGLEMNNYKYVKWVEDEIRLVSPEENFITRLFKSAGLKCKNAEDSQAFIQLYKKWCIQGKCLFCSLFKVV